MITHPFAGFVFKYADKDASECAVLYLRVRSGYWDGAEEAERRLILLQTRRMRLCMRRLHQSLGMLSLFCGRIGFKRVRCT